MVSHPTRGAWIEIRPPLSWLYYTTGRTLPGVRGLKLMHRHYRCDVVYGRTLPGVRGLKSRAPVYYQFSAPVAPYPGCVD